MTRGDRLGLADGRLGGVDGAGHLGSGSDAGDRDLDRDAAARPGPRCIVRMWMTLLDPVTALDGGADPVLRLGARGLTEQQALGLEREHHRDGDEQHPDQGGADDVPDRLLGDAGPDRRRTARTPDPMSAAKSSSSTTGSSGAFARRMNWTQERCRGPCCDSWMAVRKEKLSSTIAKPSTTSGTHHHWPSSSPMSPVVLMDLVPLVVRLVEGEQTTDAEQHDRDDEAVDVALAAVAEGVLGVASLRAWRPPSSSSSWLPESATEWIASASIDDDPVSANATNLVIAMPSWRAAPPRSPGCRLR